MERKKQILQTAKHAKIQSSNSKHNQNAQKSLDQDPSPTNRIKRKRQRNGGLQDSVVDNPLPHCKKINRIYIKFCTTTNTASKPTEFMTNKTKNSNWVWCFRASRNNN